MATTPSSPDPAVPQTGDKAKVGGIVAGVAVAALVGAARYWDDRNGTNLVELLSSLGLGVAAGGGTGLAVYKTRNRAIG